MARALINDPEIVFADEPTSNIDAASALKVLQALGRMRERGGTVVLVTHEADLLRGAGPEDAPNNPDAVYRLLDGKLGESIHPRHALHDPVYFGLSALFVGVIPIFDSGFGRSAFHFSPMKQSRDAMKVRRQRIG